MATQVNGKNAVEHIDLMADHCLESRFLACAYWSCVLVMHMFVCPEVCPIVDHVLSFAGDDFAVLGILSYVAALVVSPSMTCPFLALLA